MLRIPCPWCGLRDQSEFRYGGPAERQRPVRPDAASNEEWSAYLFYRDNPRGEYRERWWHEYGCRQWFAVTRDTVTHEFAPGGPVTGGRAE